MSFMNEPPQDVQIAQENEYLFSILEAVKLAQVMLISKNLKLNGTIGEQEAFHMTWAEIRGIATRALATGKPADAASAKIAVNQAVDSRILQNKAFDKFRVGVAGSDDPLLR